MSRGLARTRIKFCGMTSPEDVAMAVEAGADAVGIILATSERSVSLERAADIVRAIPPYMSGVGVVAEDLSSAPALRDLGLTLQFSGPTTPEECERLSAGRSYIKAFGVSPEAGTLESGAPDARMEAYEHALWMFDSASAGRFGGTGIVFRWEVIEGLAQERPIAVSGGLNAENVGSLVRLVKPYAVDVRSGIERDRKKNLERMVAFVRAVRAADDELASSP